MFQTEYMLNAGDQLIYEIARFYLKFGQHDNVYLGHIAPAWLSISIIFWNFHQT